MAASNGGGSGGGGGGSETGGEVRRITETLSQLASAPSVQDDELLQTLVQTMSKVRACPCVRVEGVSVFILSTIRACGRACV